MAVLPLILILILILLFALVCMCSWYGFVIGSVSVVVSVICCSYCYC